mgnify:CR=1 FL=1
MLTLRCLINGEGGSEFLGKFNKWGVRISWKRRGKHFKVEHKESSELGINRHRPIWLDAIFQFDNHIRLKIFDFNTVAKYLVSYSVIINGGS